MVEICFLVLDPLADVTPKLVPDVMKWEVLMWQWRWWVAVVGGGREWGAQRALHEARGPPVTTVRGFRGPSFSGVLPRGWRRWWGEGREGGEVRREGRRIEVIAIFVESV